MKRLIWSHLVLLIAFGFWGNASAQYVKGIFLTQHTFENTSKLKMYIEEARKSGINTFVIDMSYPSAKYQENLRLLKENDIAYVARVIIFPNGGNREQVRSKSYWEKKFRLVEAAAKMGANEIQLDYIRYSAKTAPSPQNAQDVREVIKWFKGQLAPYQLPLQIDVFGEVSLGPSHSIGQNLQVFHDTIDAACPMVYPSHYEPFKLHSAQPYKTIRDSLTALKEQFPNGVPFKVIPYIEMYNYRVPFGARDRRAYIKAQLKAVEDSEVDGWFAWSAGNKYDMLFSILQEAEANKDTSASNP